MLQIQVIRLPQASMLSAVLFVWIGIVKSNQITVTPVAMKLKKLMPAIH
jgi:hypothetical protein